MFTVKKIKLVFASLLIIALSLSFLTSCSDEKARATITIEGVLADNNGQSAEGLNLVLVDEYNNETYYGHIYICNCSSDADRFDQFC